MRDEVMEEARISKKPELMDRLDKVVSLTADNLDQLEKLLGPVLQFSNKNEPAPEEEPDRRTGFLCHRIENLIDGVTGINKQLDEISERIQLPM